MRSVRIVFTDTARSDLREIAFGLSEHTQDRRLAIRFVEELREAVKPLEAFPESGSIPRDRVLRSSGYRFVVYKEYLLFYLYDREAQTVYIMAVFNGRRDYMRVMKKFL
ncbi:MAG: type II toxin-antitoxin system RelE/ParE family toxin [Eubacteriales bacterium]|nr:type II toxin-antitoxin system RelE/ParE family toxin [Eubacteriales bacterium]